MDVNTRCLFEVSYSNGTVQVIEESQHRTLLFDGLLRQSVVDMSAKHQPVLEYIKAMCLAPQFSTKAKNALLLGLGGGSLVHFMQYNHSQVELAAVEKEQTIIDCARKYFCVDDSNHMLEIKKDNAWNFLENTSQKFDLIFLDVLFLDNIPLGSFPKFYEFCKQCLSKHGSIAINHILSEPALVEKALLAAQQCFDKNTMAFPLKGHFNLVIIASKNKNISKTVTALETKKAVTVTHHSDNYGYIAESL